MIKYQKIVRLHILGFSQHNIAYNCNISKKTAHLFINRAKKLNFSRLMGSEATVINSGQGLLCLNALIIT